MVGFDIITGVNLAFKKKELFPIDTPFEGRNGLEPLSFLPFYESACLWFCCLGFNRDVDEIFVFIGQSKVGCTIESFKKNIVIYKNFFFGGC